MRLVNGILGVGAALLAWGAVWIAESAESETYAHQPLALRGDRVWLESDGETRQLDDVTAFCVECHGLADLGGKSHTLGPEESSHPTGVVYPTDDSEYRAIDKLDPQILLTDGRLTCLSCHAYDAPDHRPVLAVPGGHLCQACHLL